MRKTITNQAYLRHIALGGSWHSWVSTASTGRDETNAAVASTPGNNCCNTDHYRNAVTRFEEMKKGIS